MRQRRSSKVTCCQEEEEIEARAVELRAHMDRLIASASGARVPTVSREDLVSSVCQAQQPRESSGWSAGIGNYPEEADCMFGEEERFDWEEDEVNKREDVLQAWNLLMDKIKGAIPLVHGVQYLLRGERQAETRPSPSWCWLYSSRNPHHPWTHSWTQAGAIHEEMAAFEPLNSGCREASDSTLHGRFCLHGNRDVHRPMGYLEVWLDSCRAIETQ